LSEEDEKATPPAAEPVAATPAIPRRGPLEEERTQIEAALLSSGGNQTRAAKVLGIGRRTLVNRVKQFGLRRPRGLKR
jgi:two-component system response regulator AtoC